MLYREAGQFKTDYTADMAVFPILQDRIGVAVILLVAAVIVPVFGSAFLLPSWGSGLTPATSSPPISPA
jgi:branched-chain amino acid transport system permease protein